MSDDNRDAAHDLEVLVEVARRMGETFKLNPLLQAIGRRAPPQSSLARTSASDILLRLLLN